jgi:serine/threonine protein kinase
MAGIWLWRHKLQSEERNKKAKIWVIIDFKEITTDMMKLKNLNLVHHDIKPSNIILAEDMTIKLTDFGLSRKVVSPLIGLPPAQGTPFYMAPEFRNREVKLYDPIKEDIYSLGKLVLLLVRKVDLRR